MSYVIGSWYRSDELGRRSGIFQSAAGLGVMISGYLASAVYKLDGRHGFAGWQWYVMYIRVVFGVNCSPLINPRLFLVDGIISLPIAIAGYFLIPDMPENTRAWYLTREVRYLDETYLSGRR